MASVSDVRPLSRWQSSEQGAKGSETCSPYPPIRIRTGSDVGTQGRGYIVKVQTGPWRAGGAKDVLLKKGQWTRLLNRDVDQLSDKITKM